MGGERVAAGELRLGLGRRDRPRGQLGSRSSTVSGVSAAPETSAGRRVAAAPAAALAWAGRLARGQMVEWVGGPARARVITLFAPVLALSGADAATVGAVAPQLEHALHIGNAKVGLLSSVSLLVGAVFVIPVGHARRPDPADAAAGDQHRAVERRLAGGGVRRAATGTCCSRGWRSER